MINTPNGSFKLGDDIWPQQQTPQSHQASKSEEADDHHMALDDDDDSTTSASPKQPSPKTTPKTTPKTEEELIAAAELSIQRQISISQKQLLLPVVRRRG